MADPAERANAPELPLRVELHPSLGRLLAADDPLHAALRGVIASAADELLATLGIPGQTAVELTAMDDGADERPLQLRVAGRRCHYSDELLLRVHGYVSGLPLGAVTVDTVLAWLRDSPGTADPHVDVPPSPLVGEGELLASRALRLAPGVEELGEGGTAAAETQAAEFLALLCVEVLKLKPSVLFGAEQAAVYGAALPAPPEGEAPEASELGQILTSVLDLWISIADRARVAEVLQAGRAQGRPSADLSEDLIAALRPEVIEIQLPRAYLEQLTTADTGEGPTLFPMMRDGLFYELGVHYPAFRFAPAEELRPHSFRFRINHLPAIPWRGLDSEQRLVNDEPERLRLLNLEGVPALNPANGNACSVIPASDAAAAESAGLTTWDPLGYLILSLSTDLREHGAALLDRPAVEAQLEALAQAFPALVEAVRQRVAVEQLTRVLRQLLEQQLSIRNLRGILESLLSFDHVVIDPSTYIVFDERLPARTEPDAGWLTDPANLTSFVRTRMRRYISHKYTRGQNTLIVYLLDPALERLLSGAGLDEEERERVVAAVRSEVRSLPSLASTPAILTSIEVCPPLRELIAPEFPRLPVLGYQELSPEMNIQPIARISLPD